MRILWHLVGVFTILVGEIAWAKNAAPLPLFFNPLPRDGRSLVHTFPFNPKSGGDHQHHQHHKHEQLEEQLDAYQEIDPVPARQGNQGNLGKWYPDNSQDSNDSPGSGEEPHFLFDNPYPTFYPVTTTTKSEGHPNLPQEPTTTQEPNLPQEPTTTQEPTGTTTITGTTTPQENLTTTTIEPTTTAEPDNENSVDLGGASVSGERCVEKVMMVEETEYDEEIECRHSYNEKCHITYVTDYEPQQQEDCDENFVKNCYIEYKTMTFDEPVEICNENLVRNCDKEGPTVCETVYESECSTTYHEHEVEEDVPQCRIMQIEKCRDVTQGYTTEQECDLWPKQVCTLETKNVKRYSPETQCQKKPRQVCGPGPCPIEPGPEECRQETKTVVQEIPEETCNLNPQKVCKFITKLVPVLKPRRNCVDIPKEVCTRAKKNPRKVKKPVIKKWCYTPTEESGLTTTTVPTTTTTTTTTTTSEPYAFYEAPTFPPAPMMDRYQGALPNYQI